MSSFSNLPWSGTSSRPSRAKLDTSPFLFIALWGGGKRVASQSRISGSARVHGAQARQKASCFTHGKFLRKTGLPIFFLPPKNEPKQLGPQPSPNPQRPSLNGREVSCRDSVAGGDDNAHHVLQRATDWLLLSGAFGRFACGLWKFDAGASCPWKRSVITISPHDDPPRQWPWNQQDQTKESNHYKTYHWSSEKHNLPKTLHTKTKQKRRHFLEIYTKPSRPLTRPSPTTKLLVHETVLHRL